METLAFISFAPTHAEFYYRIIYFFAILIVLFSMFLYGFKKKYEPLSWTLSVVAIISFFIIGTKLFAINKSDWFTFLNSGQLADTTGRTVIGGSILALCAALLCKKFLHIKLDFIYPLAFIAPIAKAIQRIGCFIAGCCYGSPTDLPWGIQYDFFDPHSQVHHLSQTIHPVQLYELIGLLGIPFILYTVRTRWKNQTNLFLLSLALSFLVRFICEFFRAGETNPTFNLVFGGLKTVQWLVLFGIVILGVAMYFREKSFETSPEESFEKVENTSLSLSLFTFALLGILYGFQAFLSPFENGLILGLLFVILITIFLSEIRKLWIGSYNIATYPIVILSFVLMSQTIDIQPKDYGNIDKPNPKGYFQFGAGYTGGGFHFEETVYDSSHSTYIPGSGGGGCGGGGGGGYNQVTNYTHQVDHRMTYQFMQGNLSYKGYIDNAFSVTIGFNMGTGVIKNDNAQYNIHGSRSTNTYSPYFLMDSRRVGFGFGMNFGISGITQNKIQFSNEAIPFLYLRYGNPKVYYLAFKYGDPIEPTFGMNPIKFEIGSQFGQDFLNANVGFSYNGFYTAGSVLLFQKRLAVSPIIYLAGTGQSDDLHNLSKTSRANITVGYRLYRQ